LKFGQSKVRKLRVTGLRNQDIARLDVPMQDVRLMRRRQTFHDSRQQFDALPPRARLCRGPTAQRASIDELGHDVLLTVPFTGIVHREDVRMIERGCQLGFALEASARLAIGNFFREKFQSNSPVQLRIESAVDDTHAATAEQTVDPVLA
jgi:hypothetical protein